MTEGFKPLLSAKIDTDTTDLMMQQLSKLAYPLIASPKVDGIRVLIDVVPKTRKWKEVPNRHIFNKLGHPVFNYMDGEIIVGSPTDIVKPDVFNKSQSGVMTWDGNPEFTYWVFDDFEEPHLAYTNRLNAVRERIEHLDCSFVKALEYSTVNNVTEVLELEASYLERGFEGIMLRMPQMPYKYGRSTLKQQHLIKLKRTADAEATVIDTRPLYENQNEPTKDALGHQKRSSHKAGKVEQDMLGTLVCQPLPASGFSSSFEIGSGFDDDTRISLWGRRNSLVGRIVVFKYQASGVKDRPRFPIFKGFRED